MRMNSKLLVILTLVAVIGFATVTPVSAAGFLQLGISTAAPCVCSNLAVYTFYFDTTFCAEALSAISITIPAGFTINSAYLTTTPGIIVATGNSGAIMPYTSQPSEMRTTTTAGQFEVFGGGVSRGTLTIVLPTATTPEHFNFL